jgi:hypothetical protein
MWYNPVVTQILTSPLHTLLSGGTLLLNYQGCKSAEVNRCPYLMGVKMAYF